MNEKAINVLYVDDEIHNLEPFAATFRKEFNVFTAISAKEAEIILEKETIHVLITDQRMPVTLGTELLVDAIKKYPNQTRIILTAYPEDEAIQEAQKMGLIYRYLGKPWNYDLLREYIIDGYDIFYSKINQQLRIAKHNNIKKELNKAMNKKN